jgi:chromosome segregation ATPase
MTDETKEQHHVASLLARVSSENAQLRTANAALLKGLDKETKERAGVEAELDGVRAHMEKEAEAHRVERNQFHKDWEALRAENSQLRAELAFLGVAGTAAWTPLAVKCRVLRTHGAQDPTQDPVERMLTTLTQDDELDARGLPRYPWDHTSSGYKDARATVTNHIRGLEAQLAEAKDRYSTFVVGAAQREADLHALYEAAAAPDLVELATVREVVSALVEDRKRNTAELTDQRAQTQSWFRKARTLEEEVAALNEAHAAERMQTSLERDTLSTAVATMDRALKATEQALAFALSGNPCPDPYCAQKGCENSLPGCCTRHAREMAKPKVK